MVEKFGMLVGKKVIIIVGLMCEVIDFVCYIFNYSIGKMGFVIVVVCYVVGVKVILIVGFVSLDILNGVC